MSDPVPATDLDPNVWYHVTEQNVDKDYKTNWRSILQMNQDPKVNDDNLHVWPVKTDDGNVSAFWQFVSCPQQLDLSQRLNLLLSATNGINTRTIHASIFPNWSGCTTLCLPS